ncbi:hypothetical protein FUAX_21130 [Fulvitalea axinellae]|uniref:DUF1648 domain-containing protein n=1 Tax=Fulvitalea axinellae TaxID=1182444 RepID=A0AAU9CBY6_9BACT|nr:hypothetical protein FUAX_21130 [Fulvitalea axinellae]
MNKMHSFFWGITLLLTVVVLLSVYGFMPYEVGINVDGAGKITDYVSKSQFFYGSLLFIFVANVTFYFFGRTLSNSPVRQSKPAFIEALSGWVFVFNGLVNLIMCISLVVLAGLNVTTTPFFERISFLAYGVPALFGVGVVWLLTALRKR